MSDKKAPSYDEVMAALPLIIKKMRKEALKKDMKYYVVTGLISGASLASGAVVAPVILTGIAGIHFFKNHWK